jgi:hypothetical protein
MRLASMASASARRPARASDIHSQSVLPARSPPSGARGCARAKSAAASAKRP